jgi:hypothetical protein
MKRHLLSLALFLFVTSLVAQISPKEKQALIDFYLATNGDNWINTWDLNQPVADWHGITLKNEKVVGISLLFNNIEGTLPATIGNLKNLKVLELSFNKLTGSIPVEIGYLESLELLALNGNNLSGSIPSSVGDLKYLKELHLSSNGFSGVLPTSLGSLSELEVLNVFDNDLSGTLPIGLSFSKNLRKMIVAENNIIETDSYSSLLLFNNDKDFTPVDGITPSTKTVIASESSDEN